MGIADSAFQPMAARASMAPKERRIQHVIPSDNFFMAKSPDVVGNDDHIVGLRLVAFKQMAGHRQRY